MVRGVGFPPMCICPSPQRVCVAFEFKKVCICIECPTWCKTAWRTRSWLFIRSDIMAWHNQIPSHSLMAKHSSFSQEIIDNLILPFHQHEAKLREQINLGRLCQNFLLVASLYEHHWSGSSLIQCTSWSDDILKRYALSAAWTYNKLPNSWFIICPNLAKEVAACYQ